MTSESPAPHADCILLIDDEINVINALKRVFRSEPYTLLFSTDPREAIGIAKREQPSVVLCDMRMPELSGVAVLQAIGDVAPDCARVLLTGFADVDSIIEAINLGHLHRYLSKPWNEDEVRLVVQELVGLRRLRKERDNLAQKLAEKVHELELFNQELDNRVKARTLEVEQTNSFLEQAHRELKSQYLSAVKVFSNLMELRSPQMGGHSHRVAELARALAREMHCVDHEIHDIYIAALLHDIGKIGLSDHALFTPIANLNGEARAALMKHPVKAQTALMGLPDMAAASRIIRHHHERYDGQGFPDGLMKNTIPKGARILAVAEDYDELQLGWLATKKMSEQEVLAFIQGSAGKRYDPEVVEALPLALEKTRAAERAEEKMHTGETLTAGCVLSRDFIGPDGYLWLSKDHVLTPHIVQLVREAEAREGVLLKLYTHKNKTAPYKKPGS